MGADLEAFLRERAEDLKARGEIFVAHDSSFGDIPVLTARGRGLAEAWENSLVALGVYGSGARTQYDTLNSNGEYVEPKSRDCTMTLVVDNPLSEPMIHKAFPGGLGDLEEYRQEVLDGVKDHWTRDPENPDDNRWEYTYHERLFAYKVPGLEESINQVDELVDYLAENPETRRCNLITWQPWADMKIADPACLQSFWFRLLMGDEEPPKLNMNVRFRSRDAYDAAFMNCWGFVNLQERIANQLTEKMGRLVVPGRYVDESDSYHIYGKRLGDFYERFVSQLKDRTFEDRTWTREFAEPFFDEAKPKIAEKIREQDEKYHAEGLL